jgi:hypothetical protein
MPEDTPAETMWVVKKNNGHRVLINAAAYNPQYHDLPKSEPVKVETPARKKLPEEEKKPEPAKVEVKPSPISPDQMATMSLRELQNLPAYKEIRDRTFKTKEDVIKALQEVMAE